MAQFLIVDFEHSRRTPTPEQLRKLFAAMGLSNPNSGQEGLMEETLTLLSACLAWAHEIPLAALAEALGLTVAETRDGIEQSRDRLRAIGLEVLLDQRRARLVPVSWCERPIRALTDVPPIAGSEIPVLRLLHQHDGARLADPEAAFGVAVRSTLDSLAARGLIGYASGGGPVADRKYRITHQGLLGAAKWALTRAAPPKKLRSAGEL